MCDPVNALLKALTGSHFKCKLSISMQYDGEMQWDSALYLAWLHFTRLKTLKLHRLADFFFTEIFECLPLKTF